MNKRAKRQAEQAVVPQDATEADAFLQRIGDAQRRMALVQQSLNETLAAAKAKAEAEAAPIALQIELATRGLEIWAQANRVKLTRDGATKTVRLASGEIAWRMKPPSIKLTKVEEVLALLRARKALHRFVRTKHEVNKEALLAEPDVAATIAGVTVVRDVEEFVATPTEMALAADAP